jgi:hypothetical protein
VIEELRDEPKVSAETIIVNARGLVLTRGVRKVCGDLSRAAAAQ